MYTLFSSSDILWHKALRKAINPSFTATASAGYECLIDKSIDVFLEQFNARFADKKGPEGVIDLASWMIYFSFDVIGELTYGSRHGFMESGWDSQGIISFVQKFAAYGAIVRSSHIFPCTESSADIMLPGWPVACCRQASST